MCVQGLGHAWGGWGGHAWGGAWREPAPAGEGLNVAFPALTSAIKGNNPASSCPLLEPRWIICRRQREPRCPEKRISGCLFPFFGVLFVVASRPCFVVGRIKGCLVSLVPDPIKINASKWDIKGSQRWHPGRGTKASRLVKTKRREEMHAFLLTHLLSLCSAVRQA